MGRREDLEVYARRLRVCISHSTSLIDSLNELLLMQDLFQVINTAGEEEIRRDLQNEERMRARYETDLRSVDAMIAAEQ
ncbi:hypothetical protein [Mesorhizobium sp. CN2-181]|uniref:hypothetical protein n=1 Tax=Mesorhizobium yinganensis TaxID=3157707 RepID=UPI0032B77DE1